MENIYFHPQFLAIAILNSCVVRTCSCLLKLNSWQSQRKYDKEINKNLKTLQPTAGYFEALTFETIQIVS